MPVIQNDWLKIKEKLGDRTAIFALTTAQASLLLSISEQLEWRKTYRAFGYDFADWDTLQAEVADLQRGLTMPVFIDDLVDQLGAMTDAIISLYCCPDGTPIDVTEGDQHVDHYIEDETDGVPQNIIDSGYASGSDDWAGFYTYKCLVSHVAIESMARKLDGFEELADAGAVGMVSLGAILAVLGTIVGIVSAGTFVIVLGIIGGAAAVANLYQKITTASEGLFADAAAEVRAEEKALACALFAGDGPTGSYNNMITVATSILTAPTVVLIKLMNMKADLKAMYSGRYDQTDLAERLGELGFETEDYECDDCEEIAPPVGYELIHPPQEDFSVSMNAGAVDNGSTYDEVSGIVRLKITNVSATALNFRANFDTLGGDWGHEANRHGFKVKFLGYSFPPAETGIYNIVEPPSVEFLPGDHDVGTTWGGYNTDRHAATWDPWVNQFDAVDLYDDSDVPAQRNFLTVVTGVPNEFGEYTADYKLWLIHKY